jgi:hypothetical protein
MYYLRDIAPGYNQPKIWTPDIIWLLEALMFRYHIKISCPKLMTKQFMPYWPDTQGKIPSRNNPTFILTLIQLNIFSNYETIARILFEQIQKIDILHLVVEPSQTRRWSRGKPKCYGWRQQQNKNTW